MKLKRWVATVLALTMVILTIPAATIFPEGPESCAASFSDVPDITNEQAAQLVRDAFEKYKAQDIVLYAIQGPEGESIYGYDLKNEVGVVLLGDYMEDFYKDVDLDKSLVDWYDFKNSLFYESFLGEDGNIGFHYSLLSQDEASQLQNQYFFDFIERKIKTFPVAGEYSYDGAVLEYGPQGESHICYRIRVPESDPTRYDQEEYYLPSTIYIGVDDGELYRIDEDRFLNTAFEYTIKNYSTHFVYPKSLPVPDFVKKTAYPDSSVRVRKDGLYYSMVESKYEGNDDNVKINATVFEYDFKKKKPTIRIADEVEVVTPNGKKNEPIREIDYEAFVNAKSLKKVTFGKNIKYVGTSVFENCKNLKQVKINKGVRILDNNVFNRCKSLEKIVLPESLVDLGRNAFADCVKLKTIRLGKQLDTIGKNAFKGCRSLETIYVSSKVWANYLRNEKGRKHVGIRANVKIVKV